MSAETFDTEIAGEHVSAEPHSRVTYLVKRLESAVRRDLDAIMHEQGLTTPQYAALSILRRSPGLSSAQLARRSFVTAQSMQVMVAAFERSGFIERRIDAAHQRILRNYLTAAGEAVLASSEEAADRVEKQMLAGLSDAQVKRLRETMEACVRNLAADRADALN